MNDAISIPAAWLMRARAWFMGVPAPDPVARRHAPSVLVLCSLGSAALVIGELVRWREHQVQHDLAVSCMRTLGAAILLAAFVLIRGGRFKAGVSLFVAGAVAISAVGVALSGFAANARSLTELTMPLALAALLVGRRALWTSMAAYALAFTIGGLRDAGYLWGTGPHLPPTLPFAGVGTAIMGFTVVAIVLDRVGLSLREGFELALVRQRELEMASAALVGVNQKASALFSIPPGDYVLLEVSDRGTGMDLETRRRVFETSKMAPHLGRFRPAEGTRAARLSKPDGRHSGGTTCFGGSCTQRRLCTRHHRAGS